MIKVNSSRGKMKIFNIIIKNYFLLATAALFIFISNKTYSQYNTKWMSVGSLQSWFSEIGSEIEEGRVKVQQDGMQWPSIYQYQDCEAARAFWMGSKNFTDENNVTYPYKVVHVGPRVTGAGEFFPQKFEMTSKFDPPIVSVDGVTSYNNPTDNDNVDPDMKFDRMIENVVNTQLGITMNRKIMQFSQQYHDNYFIYDYTFTNTGNTNEDEEIELPNNTITGAYFFWQYRNAVVYEIGYEIGNATRWGINTMNDVRGDGLKPDPLGQQFRAQFSWHGKYPPFTAYDNIGGPIWTPALNIASSDTVGRLGAIHFIGTVTLHADKSVTDTTNDLNQPSTTAYVGSDEPETSNNDPFNVVKMTKEYENWMAQGHKQRHADVVEPGGNFSEPTGDPSLGTPGGFSFANGFGPYDLAPGESIHIVLAEGISGINREMATEVGKQYKQGSITAKEKNEVVLTGMDSLFQTFNRAIANHQNGYDIPQPPLPPKFFSITSGGDRISLSWEVYENDPNLEGFEIYRAVGRYDSAYHLLHEASPSERSFDDVTPIRGLNYYYYIVSIGSASSNNGSAMTPAGRLISSRYYTQSYDPAQLKRPAGDSPFAAKIVGNQTAPFLIRAGVNDKLKIGIDTLDAVIITLPADSAAVDTLKINEVVDQINTQLGTNVASDNGFGKLVLISPTTGLESKIDIQSVSEDAYSAIGLKLGVVTGGIPTTQEALNKIRVVPNPFNISAAKELGFGDDQANRLAFFNIPGRCTIKIYTEIGELIETIEHTDGSGDDYWDSVTSSNQIVVSGIYIAVVENNDTGERKIVKFAIIR
ncbi:MAG: hypothetical protein A2W11_13860 [Ignavibacteria bacterium RBG_16_35_7]|nr:MAG: hypothetical protein A2W11_13860 [Ignavibacteria bacterium RBG_16_35_7]